MPSKAGGVKTFDGGGDMGTGADAIDWREVAGLLVVPGSLVVAALSFWIDGEVYFKMTRRVEDDQVTNSDCGDSQVAGDGKDHQGIGLRQVGVGG